jgi:AcrR family transcriptional regulator
MTPEQRREAIIDATSRVMVRQGIAATTARDVAAEMGTSSGLIHHYFSSMDQLLADAFARVATADFERTVEACRNGRDAIERLAHFITAYNSVDEEGAMQLWLDAWAEASRRPALQRSTRRLNEEWQALLAELLRTGVAEGLMVCGEPDAVAWRLVSLLDGLALQTVAHGDLISREQAVTWAQVAAELELGLAPGALAMKVGAVSGR